MSVTSVSNPDGHALRDAIGDARSILLLAPDEDVHGDEACTSLLSVAPPAEEHLLSVTLEQTPDERLSAWRANVGELPARTGIIAADETTRSAAAAAGTSSPGLTPVSIESVSDPGDLTGLAVAISAYLDAWADVSATTVVCFHSLSELLEHAELPRVFRFVHATTGRLSQLGSVAHYHLDPTRYDASTINTLTPLFDAIVEIDDDGSASVRTR